MKKNIQKIAVPVEIIQNKIYLIRRQKVMLDRDLALLYGVLTSQLTRQVRRNIERFPENFMFQLTKEEADSSRCQIGILKRGQNIKYLPYVFTEQGVAMLSSVLRSPNAVQVNIQIMRVFTQLRHMIDSHKELRHKIEEMEKKYDSQFSNVFAAIRQLMSTPKAPAMPVNDDYKRRKAGFITEP